LLYGANAVFRIAATVNRVIFISFRGGDRPPLDRLKLGADLAKLSAKLLKSVRYFNPLQYIGLLTPHRPEMKSL